MHRVAIRHGDIIMLLCSRNLSVASCWYSDKLYLTHLSHPSFSNALCMHRYLPLLMRPCNMMLIADVPCPLYKFLYIVDHKRRYDVASLHQSKISPTIKAHDPWR